MTSVCFCARATRVRAARARSFLAWVMNFWLIQGARSEYRFIVYRDMGTYFPSARCVFQLMRYGITTLIRGRELLVFQVATFAETGVFLFVTLHAIGHCQPSLC